MISYVECLGGDSAGPGVVSHCWNTETDEERDELLPRKMVSLQPKTEGSLRRRLLSAKIYQQHNAWLNTGGAAGMPGSPTNERKPLSPHLHYPSSWYRPQHLPQRPHIHPAFAPEAHGKLFLTPDIHGKAHPQSPPLQQQQSTYPILSQWRRTSSCPPTLEPCPSYNLLVPSHLGGQTSLKEHDMPPQYHCLHSRGRRSSFFCFRRRRGRRSGQEATHSTPLLHRAEDGDRKWSVHYTTQKLQQGLSFVPGKRRSDSADNLQACNGLIQHGPTSSHFYHPSSASSMSFSGLDQLERSTCSEWKKKSRKMSSASSDEDEKVILSSKRPLTPLVLNPVHLTSSLDVFATASEPTVNVELEPISCLPTPEERMRQLSKDICADIVPINITGESFDRQASFRRTLSSADSLSRRPLNLSHRSSLVVHGQLSTVGGSASSCTSNHQQKTRGKDLEDRERGGMRKEEQSSERNTRAPRRKEMSGLAASLTWSPRVESCQNHSCCSPSSEVQTLRRLATNSSINSEANRNNTSYRTLSASSSCCQSQDLDGFLSELMPLLPFDHKARVIPESPFSSSSSLSSSPFTSSLPSPWSSPSDKPLNETTQCHGSTSSSHHLSSSSIVDSESQFSYQALDDQTQHSNQFSYDDGSSSELTGNYQPLSPSSSPHSSQTGGDWNSISQEAKSFSEEDWSCDPLLSSGRSSPASSESNSLCSEKITSSLSLNQEKKKFNVSTYYSRTIIRSISLSKSKYPPPPPLRSDSLRRRPGCTKPSCSPSPRLERSSCLERTIQQTLTLSSQTFHDPWVPRNNTKRRQSGLNCGTVTSFEPLSLDHHALDSIASSFSSDHLPQSPSHSHAHVFSPGISGSEESLRFMLNSQAANTSVVGLQRLASPSSGYSSQSNTSTPSTPLSSPLTPSSPLTASPGAFSLTPQLSSSHSSCFPLSPSVSSLPRTRSRRDERPKPPVPERKSSLLSSLSSSFSSTSSLSSCTSSEHPSFPAPQPPLSSLSSLPPPPPPPPPPLPLSSLPIPPLPPFLRPPPPPYSYAIREASLHALESTFSPSTVFPPPTPPPPSSETPALPLTNLPPPPPPPPLPSMPGLCTSPFSSLNHKSLNPCVRFGMRPLVTAQALQGVKLRSVKNPKSLSAATTVNHADTCHDLPSKEAQAHCSVLANANVDGLVNAEAKQARAVSQNDLWNPDSIEASMSNCTSGNGNRALKSALRSDDEYYKLTKGQMKISNNKSVYDCLQSLQGIVSRPTKQGASGCQATNGKTQNIQSNKQDSEESDTCSCVTLPNINTITKKFTITQNASLSLQQVKDTTLTDAMLTKPAGKHINTEDDSSYRNLSVTNEVPHRQCRGTMLESKDEIETNDENLEKQNQSPADINPVTYSDVKLTEKAFKSACPMKLHSPEKLIPPKKPDLCILGLMASSETKISPDSSSQKQKPTILQKTPALSLTSPRKTKPISASRNTGGTLTSHKQNTIRISTTGIINITGSKNVLAVSSEACCPIESSNLGRMGNEMWTCLPSGVMGVTQDWNTIGVSNTMDVNMRILENDDTSRIWQTLGTSGDHGISLSQTGGTQSGETDPCTLYKDNPKIFQMRSSLDENKEEDKKVQERQTNASMMMLSTTKKREKLRKTRNRMMDKQLLMMSSKMEPSPSSSSSSLSSSSSSSSSGDEQDVVKLRIISRSERLRMMKKMCDKETSGSESSRTQISQSRYSLSSALSTESLQGQLSLPDLLIQETGEEEEERHGNEETQKAELKAKETRGTPDANLFVSVSADQMFVSSQPRTTEDLFAVIHRCKRKVLGRRNLEEDRRCITSFSCSSSQSVTSANSVSCSTRPIAFKSQRSTRSERFKALLLRKGSQSNSCSQISAVERLCKVLTSSTNFQHMPSLTSPPEQTQFKPKSLFNTLDRHDIHAPQTLDAPVSPTSLYSQNPSFMLGFRQRALMHTHLLFLSSSMHLCSPTPPCSARRDFAARCRLVAAPMTVIFEGECEDEEEEED